MALLAEAASRPLGFLDASGFGDTPPPFEILNDVAVIDVAGVLLQEEFTLCGFTIADGYDAIVRRAGEAFAHNEVGALQIRGNTPGGECAGCNEAATALRNMARESGKPLDMYVDEGVFSAGVWLSTAVSEVLIPPTGTFGSIGVLWPSINESAALANVGLVAIVAADPPGKLLAGAADLLPPQTAQLERMQAHVTDMMSLFAGAVSEARSISIEKIRGFDAGIFMGKAAVEVGLADAVMGRKAALDRTRGKIKRKAYSMPKEDKSSPYGSALVKLLGLDPKGDYTTEQIEKAAIARNDLAELGAYAMEATGAPSDEDAIEIIGLWQKSHAALPRVQRELATREIQLAVSTGRILPKDAYSQEATDREYPALPVLHPEIAGKSVAVLRARFEGASPAPETVPTGKPRPASVTTRGLSDAERGGLRRSGLSEADYLAHMAKFNDSKESDDDGDR